MSREKYAQNINWKGSATRAIRMEDVPDFKIGEIINPGLSWTDGGVFECENVEGYLVIFECENVEGYKVNYDNEKECCDLSCSDCDQENEILVNSNFKVIDFWEYDETGFARVFLQQL
jgi:hypothetical protein